MNFFKFPVDKSLACGQFTIGHIIFMLICFLLIGIGLFISVKKIKNMNKFLIIIGCAAIVLEIAKVVWGLCVNRYDSVIKYLPLWFCSLFVPASILAGFCKGKVKKLALSFMVYGGIVGGFVYLFFPTTSLLSYPAFHFLSFHSMLYHSLMIYTGVMILINNLVTPSIKDFLPYFIFTTSFCIISFFVNEYFGTNFMFLHDTSNNDILKLLQNLTGKMYPVALTLLQNIGTFFISFGLYKLIFLKKSK